MIETLWDCKYAFDENKKSSLGIRTGTNWVYRGEDMMRGLQFTFVSSGLPISPNC